MRIARTQVSADEFHRLNRNAQQYAIKVFAFFEGQRLAVGPVVVHRFEFAMPIGIFGRQRRALHQLRVIGYRGPGREILHRHQRGVFILPVLQGGLTADHHLVDLAAIVRFQRKRAMKKPEFHAALFEHLVERCEDGVAHATLHFPEHRTTRTQQQPQQHADRNTRREGRPVGIAVDKSKHIAIGGISGRIVQAFFTRALAPQPLA